MSLARGVATVTGLAASWALAGHAVIPHGWKRDTDFFTIWATALALGAGIAAVAMMALAASGILTTGSIIVVAVGEALVAALVGARGLAGVRGIGLVLPSEDLSHGWARAGLVALLLVILLAFFATLAPPSSMDATVYHLRVPRDFLRAQSWVGLEVPTSYQPLYVEMLFCEAMALGGDVAAALVHWVLGVGAIIAAAGWGRRLSGTSLWAAVMFGATGLFVWESTCSFIDLGLTLFSALALYWAIADEAGWRSALVAGLLAGLAGGSKFTGMIVVVLAVTAALAAAWPAWRRGLTRPLLIAAAALPVAAPWYVRDYLLTGNPTYPVANEYWGLPKIPLALDEYGHGRDLLHFLMSPLDLLARGETFDQGWSLGPAVLALSGIGFWVLRRSRIGRIAAAAVATWWIVWFWSSPQTRLLLPVLPILTGLASVGLRAAIYSSRRALRFAAGAVVAIPVTAGLVAALVYVRLTGAVVLGLETKAQYLTRTSWNYVAFDHANRLLPADARIAVVGAYNLYYLDRAARWFATEPSSEELARGGFSHVLAVAPCGQPPTRSGAFLWTGDFPLIASRARGGTLATVCSWLWAVR